jgi:hypothetical protein
MNKITEVFKGDRRPYVSMMVEKYKATKYDQKFFVLGFAVGIVPYIIHMKF